jgi:hypothetical protein
MANAPNWWYVVVGIYCDTSFIDMEMVM